MADGTTGQATTVSGTFRADVGADARVALHLSMPDGSTFTVMMEPLPAWVTDEESSEDRETRRREREDRLPKDRSQALRDILQANGITDHDSASADAAYREWKANGRRGTKPTADLGGMLDGFDCAVDKRKPSCLCEAFERDTRPLKTWRDMRKVLAALADALKVDELRLPDDVTERHISQDIETQTTEV